MLQFARIWYNEDEPFICGMHKIRKMLSEGVLVQKSELDIHSKKLGYDEKEID